MCFLLTGLVAFCEATHDTVIKAGLVPQLVVFCRFRSAVSGYGTEGGQKEVFCINVSGIMGGRGAKAHGLMPQRRKNKGHRNGGASKGARLHANRYLPKQRQQSEALFSHFKRQSGRETQGRMRNDLTCKAEEHVQLVRYGANQRVRRPLLSCSGLPGLW